MIIDADAFNVKLAVIGTFLKTDAWNRSYHVTDQFVVTHGFKKATRLSSSLKSEYSKKTGYQ